ncbi:MAG: YciI family protein [Paracoccaceae bacterium]
MQYIALIYSGPDAAPKPETPEFGAMMQGYMACTETFKTDGVMLAGDALHGTDKATSLRIRGGKIETMDGPFAETKEQLGGYYLFECENLDAALKYAAMIPTAAFGTIEVRPVMSPEDYGA